MDLRTLLVEWEKHLLVCPRCTEWDSQIRQDKPGGSPCLNGSAIIDRVADQLNRTAS